MEGSAKPVAGIRPGHDDLRARITRSLLASLLLPSGLIAAVTARADGPWLSVWVLLTAVFGAVFLVPLVMPERHPLLAAQARWPVLAHRRRWTFATSLVALIALLLAATWTVVNDDLLYISLGFGTLGLVMLSKIRKESRALVMTLAVLLLLPYANLVWVISMLEE